MEKSVEPIAAPEAKDDPSIINRAIKIASVPIAALSGMWVTHTYIRTNIYRNVSKGSEFKALEKKFGEKYQENMTNRMKGAIDKETHLSRWGEIKEDHRKEMERMVETLGVDGFFSQWKNLSRSTKQRAIVEGLTVSGIAIGALLTIANSKTISNLFSSKSKEESEPQR